MQGLQLPLGVQLSDAASFESFHQGPNRDAVAALRALADSADAPPLMLLYGASGSGKTHLLHALARHTASAQFPCAYLPLRQLAAEGPELLQGLEHMRLVALDDIDAVLDLTDWPVALARLLDQLRAAGQHCVLSAHAAAERLDLSLPDLRTRLTAAAAFGLRPLNDDDRQVLLQTRARVRGMEMPADAARLLLSRLPRDAGALLDALDRLDHASLSARRRLSLPFVQQWLKQQPE